MHVSFKCDFKNEQKKKPKEILDSLNQNIKST